MTKEYYIQKNGGQVGPFSFEDILQQDIDVSTPVSIDNGETWQPASDLPEFFQYFEANGFYFPTEDNLAGFWWRVPAYFVDSIILSFPLSGIQPAGLNQIYERALNGTATPQDLAVTLQASAISSFIVILYHIVCDASALQGSLGKKLFRLVVVDADGRRLSIGRAFARNLGKYFTASIIVIGYFSALWSERKQTWYDKWANAYVLIRNR